MDDLDRSVLVGALLSGQASHEESLNLLSGGEGAVSPHGLLETFATLTG